MASKKKVYKVYEEKDGEKQFKEKFNTRSEAENYANQEDMHMLIDGVEFTIEEERE